MIDSIKQDAREYGQHVKAGGWRLGLLVARCVKKGKTADASLANLQNVKVPANVDRAADGTVEKVSIAAFAKAAGVGKGCVTNHLDAWDKAAEAKVVPAAEALTPGKEVRLPDAETWGEYYTSVSGGYNGGKDRVPTKALVEQQLDLLPAKDRAALATLLVAQTEVREEIKRSGPLAVEQHLDLGGEIVREIEDTSNRTMKTEFPSHAARTAADEIGDAARHLNNALAEIIQWNVTEEHDRLRLVDSALTRAERACKEIRDCLVGQPA